MQTYDTIIIGTWLGWLVAGAKLAKEGKKVLLIEQHSIPGGCATNFKRMGSSMDVGLHEMDGLDEWDIKTPIFQELWIFENLDFIRVPEFYRFTNGRTDIIIPDNQADAEKLLIEHFPDEIRGIQTFFRICSDFRKEIYRMPRNRWKLLLQFPIFPLLYRRLVFSIHTTLGQFMDSIIKNNELKLILCANIGYYHDLPDTMALSYFAIAQAGYYMGGGHYIKGGSQVLSDYLVSYIRNLGGEIILGNTVKRILCQGGTATGIEYTKTVGNHEIITAYGTRIIANAAIPYVASELLPQHPGEKIQIKTKKMENACSLLSIYLFFKRPIRELGNTCYSTFVFDSKIRTIHDFDYHTDFHERGYVFVDYSQIDSWLAKAGKGVGAICTVDYIEDWEHLSDSEYKNKKDEVARIYIDRLEALIPWVREEIEYYEVGTPKTIRRYTLSPNGTPYGFAQIPKQAGIRRIPIESPVKNLYFASAWTVPWGWFTGAIISGYFCAETILGTA